MITIISRRHNDPGYHCQLAAALTASAQGDSVGINRKELGGGSDVEVHIGLYV